MIAVSNTTPILGLFKIGQLDLLRLLFEKVFVPMTVYDEIAVLGHGKLGHDVLDTTDFIRVKEIKNIFAANVLRSQLDQGEAEAIVLAMELNANVLLLDEKKARKVAQANSQPIVGTIGVLQAAKNKGLISDMKTHLYRLIANGVWIDARLCRAVLRDNGEL